MSEFIMPVEKIGGGSNGTTFEFWGEGTPDSQGNGYIQNNNKSWEDYDLIFLYQADNSTNTATRLLVSIIPVALYVYTFNKARLYSTGFNNGSDHWWSHTSTGGNTANKMHLGFDVALAGRRIEAWGMKFGG